MAANFAALAQAWNGTWGSLGSTLPAKLAALNALTAAGPLQDVAASAVAAHLAGAGALASIEAYAASPPAGAPSQAVRAANYLALVLADPTFATFATSQPETFAEMTAFVAALSGDPRSGLTPAIGASLLALAQPPAPWWLVNGFPGPIGVSDLVNAGII